MSRPRVAIVHDYLTQRGGAERVVLELARAFPGAPLYTSLYAPDLTYTAFDDVEVRVGPLNTVAWLRRHHRAAFPFLAPAFSAMRVDADVVICSSSGWAHGVRTTGVKVVYCYSVARWLTQRERYLGDGDGWRRRLAGAALTTATPLLRRWDRHAAASATQYLAVSEATRRAIADQYAIDAPVVYPPTPRIAAATVPIQGVEPGFFLCVSRLLPYKNVDVVCGAFAALPDARLLVVGDGPERAALQARGPANVTFRRHVSDAQLRWAYEECTALVAASHEDFGLTVLEAAAAGRPTVALRSGGFLETVIEGATGVFFDVPESASVARAVRAVQHIQWDTGVLQARAAEFAPERFATRMRGVVDALSAGERAGGR